MSRVGQSKRHSLLEALMNILIGYGVAVGAQLAIFPLFNIHVPLHSNLSIGGLFSIVSLCRSFTLRRIFNLLHVRGIL